MEYKDPYPSAVPHAILMPRSFNIPSVFYGCSIVIQGFFLGISVMFFALALYFKLKNHKLLIDQSNNKAPKKDKENIICEVVAHKQFYGSQEDDQNSSHDNESQQQNSLQSQLFGGVLRIYQRRLVYAATFTIPWAFCINFFDADIVLVICAAIFMAFVLLFNIRRMLPDWKITILLYFLPAIASSFPYIGGTHQLYAWTPVKDPLKLQV